MFANIGRGEHFLTGKTVIADTGYHSIESINAANELELNAYIPDQNFRKRDISFIDKGRFNPEKKEKYSRDDFVYDHENDIVICPDRSRCLRNDKTRYRVFQISIDESGHEYTKEMIKKIDTVKGRDIYSKRMSIVEPPFVKQMSLRTSGRIKNLIDLPLGQKQKSIFSGCFSV